MKKNSNKILTALALLGLLAACVKPEQEVVEKKALKVVTSDVIFGVEGGTGSILVDADDAVTAVSERAWCQVSVDGKKIVVSVPEANPSRMSRYARIVIKAGSDEVHVTAQQFGEVFSGIALEDAVIPKEGATLTLSYTANMNVQMSSDQNWVHFEMVEDEALGKLVKVIVDENAGFGTRFATVSYSAGSSSGSARFIQEPTYAAVTGWTVEDVDGRYVFPDQIDKIQVTPPAEMESAPYYWGVVDPSELLGKDIPMYIKELADATKEAADAGQVTLSKGADSDEFENLPSTATAFIVIFDGQNYPTGQYAVVEVPIPDRGPQKQLVDGWEISHGGSAYVHPDQQDSFTIIPKAGYEDVKYIATAVKKDAVADVESFAFTNFAMSTREEILAKVASGELPSFEAGLFSGETTLTAKNLPVGDVYVVVVAFGDNKFYTGDYSFAEFAVTDAKRAYWTGTWTMTNDAGDTYNWTIQEKDDDSGYLTMYCDGLYTGTGAKLKTMNWVDLRYNDDGSITLMGQIHEELTDYYNSTYGDIYPGLFGFYTNAEGKVYYKTNAPYDIFDVTFNAEGTAVVTNVRLASGDFPYDSFAIRYYSSVKGSRFSFTSNKTIKIPGLKLTKQ